VGRLPVQTALSELDEEALIQILTKPKNYSGIKPYPIKSSGSIRLNNSVRFFSSLKSLTSARGLRSILEDMLLDTMFELPSFSDIKEVVIDKSVVEKKKLPVMVYKTTKKQKTITVLRLMANLAIADKAGFLKLNLTPSIAKIS
jgi:ATP-dependent Clp protease ATP-binding subunit ClpX